MQPTRCTGQKRYSVKEFDSIIHSKLLFVTLTGYTTHWINLAKLTMEKMGNIAWYLVVMPIIRCYDTQEGSKSNTRKLDNTQKIFMVLLFECSFQVLCVINYVLRLRIYASTNSKNRRWRKFGNIDYIKWIQQNGDKFCDYSHEFFCWPRPISFCWWYLQHLKSL